MAHRLPFAVPFPPNHGSASMEPSISTSSISSSVSSSLASVPSSVSSAIPPSLAFSYQPATPERNSAVETGNDLSTYTMAPGTKKPLDISNLMSPPEPDQLDCFSVNDDRSRSCTPAMSQSQTASKSTSIPRNGPLSPPISPRDKKPDASPYTPADDSCNAGDQTSRDPILYPAANENSLVTQSRPLFASSFPPATGDKDNASHVVDGHVAARSTSLFSRTSPPRGEDYELALYMRAEMMNTIAKNPRSWLRKEREQLVADRLAAATRNRRLLQVLPAVRSTAPAPRPSTPRLMRLQFSAQNSQGTKNSQPSPQILQHQQHQQHQQQYRYSTDQQSEPQALQSRQHKTSSTVLHPLPTANNRVAKRSRAAPARIAPQISNSPRQAGGNGGSGSNGSNMRMPGSSPEPRVRTTAPNREDKDFASLEDYCPPLDTLPERTNNLKVDWKGNALDLSQDAYLHLLHRDEVGLAASLRLDCATYLTSKRRIFIRRLECARIGKEFRKTDAQQACKIDVNKASKLWTAYEKVGWLRMEHMKKFL